MDSRDQAVAEALRRIDPALGGLFKRGVELADQVDDPSVPYLVGHAGRELSRATLSFMAQEATRASESIAGDPSEEAKLRERLAHASGLDLEDHKLDRMVELLGDGHRPIVARALALGEDHPLVSAWLNLHRELVSVTHYQIAARRPDPERSRSAFRNLATLLYYRLAPYFDTEEDLDSLLRVEAPGPEDLEQLRALLVRPRLRFRFFALLEHPAWLEHLLEMGVFDRAPEWRQLPDGRYQFVSWPEGECLVRLASRAPNTVLSALQTLPEELQNPVVWDVVARAILALPGGRGRRLAALMARALARSEVRGFRHNMVDAAAHLAESGEVVAFRLVFVLLGLRPVPREDEDEDGARWFRHRSEDLLERLDRYEFDELLKAVTGPLIALDAARAYRLFRDRLSRSLAAAAQSGFEDSHLSQHWGAFAASQPHGDDVRAALAKACLQACRALCQERPEEAEGILESLEQEEADVFARMRLLLLADVAESQEEILGRVMSAPDVLDPVFGAAEVAELLRRGFQFAPGWAKEAFARNLLAGPAERELRASVEWRGENPDDPAAIQEALADWQRRRLRWFHDAIPPELLDLASELGVEAAIPSPRRQALDEVGVYSGGAVWRGEVSPVTPDEIRSMTHTDLLRYLLEWRPDPGRMESPSRQGLADVLRDMVAGAPTGVGELLDQAAESPDLHPTYRRALLGGLDRAVEGGLDVPWPVALKVCWSILRDAQHHSADPPGEWLWARNSAIELVASGCGKDLLDFALVEEVLALTEFVIETSPSWPTTKVGDSGQFDEIVHTILNTEAGKATHLLISAALWAYRAGQREWVDENAARIDSMLEASRTRQDDGRAIARARIGEFVPQLLLLRPSWLHGVAEDLFEDGMARPLEEPAFGSYLVLARLYRDGFQFMRPWLARHVVALEDVRDWEDSAEGHRDDWSLSRHFLEQAALAYIQGMLRPEDPDELLEKAFSAARPSDRGHFYWQLYRGWTDSDTAPPQDYVDRVVWLWRWRLEARDAQAVGQESEDEGLMWLFLTPYLPAEQALELVSETVRLQTSTRGIRGLAWPRLAELVEIDAPSVLKITEEIVRLELAGEWPHFNQEELAPLLRSGLGSPDTETRERALSIIHTLGDRGWDGFGDLLRS